MTSKDQIIGFFADFIEKEMGIKYKENNYYQLENRLNEVVKQLNFDSLDDLFSKSKSIIPSTARDLILDIATNNETSFFRDKEVFKSFKENILESEKFSGPNPQTIRIWSAASSTGQEAYSLAILCEEWKEKMPGRNYQIIGTDFSERVLMKAREGIYTQLEVQRGMPAPKLIKYFTEAKIETKFGESKAWKIRSELKSNVHFKHQNLLKPFIGLGPFDFILCRNVLIYFDVDTKKSVIERVEKALNPKGYLVLGAAESLIGVSESLAFEKIGKATFYRKKEP